MTFSRDERAALCRLLTDLGPGAPTLCEGWDTHDLAAHLVARERRPDSGPGLVLSALAGWTEKVRRGEKRRPYADLVEQVRQGPPVWSPLWLSPVESAVNAAEFFVHHEDVRRAQPGWQPRELPHEVEESLWRRLRAASGRLFRRVPVGVLLRRPDGVVAPARSGSPQVQLVGRPSELMLYAFGRRAQARVEVEGEPDAVRKLAEAPVGL